MLKKAITVLLTVAVFGSMPLLAGCGKSSTARASEKKEQVKQLMRSSGNWGEINTLLQASVADNPKDPEAQFLLGVSFYNLRNYPAALDHLQTDLELDAGNVQARLIIGNVYRDMNQIDKAETAYRDLIKRAPDFAQTYLNLARMLEQEKRPKDALAVLEDGASRAQGTEVLLELGERYRTAGQTEKARAVYQKVLREDPEHQQAKDALAKLK